MAEAVKETGANVSIIFVPPAFAGDAIMEAAAEGIELIVAITEGLPTRDMIAVQSYLAVTNARPIGPICQGVITPGEANEGIMHGFVFQSVGVGIVYQSVTLTYEAVDHVGRAGFGISTSVR